jgi:hypothetical protein
MSPHESANGRDQRRTKNSVPEFIWDMEVAGIDGTRPDNGSGRGWFDPEECALLKSQQLSERSELRLLLVDWLGDERLMNAMNLYVHLSLREIAPDNPSRPYRSQASERPFLQHLILLAAFDCDYGIAGPLQVALDFSRAEIMASSAIAKCLRSEWAVVSPRTARAIPALDAWAVPIGTQHRCVSLSEDQISRFVLENGDSFLAERDTYLSVTHQENTFVMSAIKLLARLEPASIFAQSIGQRVIFNIGTQQIIETRL